ncbi:MAG: hypothetical protein U9R57_08810 [Thermodesulfobacteriota bacterium]|nr:hypothetical protein [Thermodesulfobacteriota bacterium]
MTDETSKLDEMKASIEQLRDEIKLKAHLGKEDAIDEWEKLDKKWNSFLEQYKPVAEDVAEEAGKAAGNAGAALRIAADELKAGYERIRKLF